MQNNENAKTKKYAVTFVNNIREDFESSDEFFWPNDNNLFYFVEASSKLEATKKILDGVIGELGNVIDEEATNYVIGRWLIMRWRKNKDVFGQMEHGTSIIEYFRRLDLEMEIAKAKNGEPWDCLYLDEDSEPVLRLMFSLREYENYIFGNRQLLSELIEILSDNEKRVIIRDSMSWKVSVIELRDL